HSHRYTISTHTCHHNPPACIQQPLQSNSRVNKTQATENRTLSKEHTHTHTCHPPLNVAGIMHILPDRLLGQHQHTAYISTRTVAACPSACLRPSPSAHPSLV